MPRVILSIGLPGSGKTTILQPLAEKLHAAYISPDSIRKELHGNEDDHADDKEIWRIARVRISESLQRGESVVFDSTFSRPDRRRAFINDCKAAGAASIEGIVFDIPLDEVLRRNGLREKNVDAAHIRESFEQRRSNPPNADDGFDVLIRVDEKGTWSDLLPPKGTSLISEVGVYGYLRQA
jgi:predicted kinase